MIALCLLFAWAQQPWPARDDVGVLEPGVGVQVFWIGEPLDRLLRLVDGQTPNAHFAVARIELGRDELGEHDQDVLVSIDGFVRVPAAGAVGFRLSSDDGSRLWIDGREVLDNDGLHEPRAREAAVELAAGWHRLRVRWFQAQGDAQLTLEWRPPGRAEFGPIPVDALGTPAGDVRVTAPGPKRVLRPLARGGPGDGEPLDGVHPSFALRSLRPEGFEPRVGGLGWLSDGRLVVCTWDAEGAVYLLEPTDAQDPAAIEVQRFASGLAEPLGLAVVEDRIFVLQKQELTELIDSQGAGVADEYRAVCSGWDVSANFHEFAFGLAWDENERAFYANLAVAIEPGGKSSWPQAPERGSVLRIDLESGDYEVVAHGLRTPNGIGRGAGGELFVTDNQGDWVPVSKLLRLRRGAFYGSRAVLGDDAAALPVEPPVVWLPQNEIGNSPSQPAPLDVGPWSGQMIVGDVTHGGLKRVFVEEVDGVLQGSVFRFSQGFEAGVNRLAWSPDGALVVGGIGSTGNWSQTGKAWFGLERLDFTGAAVFEPLAVRTRANGLEVEFSEPLAAGSGWDPSLWDVEQWRYEATADYGGAKLGRERVDVRTASVSADRRRVFIELPGLRTQRVVHLRMLSGVVSASGRAPWTTESWTTVHRLPVQSGEVLASPLRPTPNALTAAERAAGWRLLFDGHSLDGWHSFGAQGEPRGWEVRAGCIVRSGPGGDLVTDELFEDFELSLEWRIARGGNSGIFFHVADGYGAVWETGPEFQVLDNAGHRDGLDPRTSAGANYALHAPARDDTRPVGCFNRARLRVQGGGVEHWLNGVLQCRYQLGSPAWAQRVAGSKFASLPAYGRAGRGRIALQDHGDTVWFRDVRLRELPPAGSER